MSNDRKAESGEDGIRTNIAQIAEAVNAMDLDRYGSLVTADFVNMNQDLQGRLSSTVGRQARLDVLRTFFEHSPYRTTVTMLPSEVHVHGARGFARVDGTAKLTPKEPGELSGYGLKLDIYLFFHNVEGCGWQSERSMGIEKARTDE